MSTKKGLLYQRGFSLTQAESEVLQMITEEFLTIKQIQIRRQCSKQAVYKIIKILRIKGALTNGLQKGGSSQPTHQRLHGQQFRIRIINKTQKYLETLKRCNQFGLDENTIRLYSDLIEIYSGKSFFGINEQEATDLSMLYWKNFITRLENEIGVILQKNRVQNIKIVKQHYAETNSQLAKESGKVGQEVKVLYHDGKLSVVMDNSFGLNERECIHPEHNKQHSEAISKQVKDFIENDPPTNSELTKSQIIASEQITQLTSAIAQTQVQLLEYRKQNQEHLKLIQEYRKENKNWRKGVFNKLKEENEKLKQKKLSEWN